jgi:hypothetical protein
MDNLVIWFFAGLIIGLIIPCKKQDEIKLSTYNVNFGDEIMILGHKFIADPQCYYWDESKTYWFSQTNTFINNYGTFPNINLSQEEFFKRLDAL